MQLQSGVLVEVASEVRSPTLAVLALCTLRVVAE
jgi:hypothetical protein